MRRAKLREEVVYCDGRRRTVYRSGTAVELMSVRQLAEHPEMKACLDRHVGFVPIRIGRAVRLIEPRQLQY